jgi:enoyl-CoA hydratase/carnithine racemase
VSARLNTHSEGATLVLTISNPEHRNALGPELYAAGVEALSAADGNPDVRSIVLTGEGSHFCAGGNLQRLLANRQKDPSVQAESIEGLHSWVEALRACPKPVIAAVEGSCAGAGFSLALACDFVVAAANSVFVMAYSNVGLSPDGGGSWSLARALPRATAMALLMGGERIAPDRLQALGVINAVCNPGDALTQALALAERLNQRAPTALASIKELVNDAATAPLHTQLAAERDHFVRNLHHSNAGEGIAAFMEKRPARYR